MGDRGYDKESNMKGKQCSAQESMRHKSEGILYTLQLVVIDATSNLYSVDFFTAVQLG